MIDPEKRRLAIGGSEVGAIFGCDENRSAFDIWARKKGGVVETGDRPIRMVVGKALEQGVLSLYEYVTGRKVEYCDVTSLDPVRSWMAYTPDALVVNERRGVDAKVVFWDQRHKWGGAADEIPQRVQLQAWWYMAALHYEVWDVCALIGEGEPRVYTIERDPGGESAMLDRTYEWHKRYLLGDEVPEMGNSRLASAWLQRAFPVHKRPDMKEASEVEKVMLLEYATVRGAQSALKTRREQLENELKLAVGNREGLEFDCGKFTWRKAKGKTETDWKSLAIGLLNAHVKDEAARAELMDIYTTTGPESRRIWFSYDGANLLAA